MWETLLDHEPAIRLSVFLGIFAVMAILEVIIPCRARSFSRLKRWPHNIGLVVFNTLVLRLLFPTAAVGMALMAAENGWGLFNMIELPLGLVVVLSVVLMDLVIYGQHVLVHVVPLLWRLHRMHHADLDFDVTTGARFHPLEIIFSMTIKLGVVMVLGVPAVAVLIFEVILNGAAMFNHSNIKLPKKLDRALRLIVVTPDMHRVHHSVVAAETNSNYGFNLPWWDRLFGTYIAEPQAGQVGMTIGLPQFRTERDLRLDQMLRQPWRKKSE